MISVSYHDRVNVLQETIAIAPSPFERAEWFALLAQAGQHLLIAKAGGTALVLTPRGDRIESLTNWYSFIWKPLGAAARPELTAIAQSLRGKSHRIVMSPVPDEDGSAETLAEAFKEAGWNVTLEKCDHNHVLPTGGRSFAEYWAQRPGQMRTTLKRKAKKVDVAIHTSFDNEAWAQYEAIYKCSWKPAEGDPELLRHFAKQEGDAGRIRLAVAKFGGEAVAAQFWTVEGGTAYIHKLAHLEEHKNLSAGTTLTAALLERVIDTDGVSLVDFGTGNDAYKSDWMEQDRPRYRIDCLDPVQPKAWPALLKRMLRRVAPSHLRS